MILEISSKKKNRKFSNIWKLNNTQKKKAQGKFQKYFERIKTKHITQKLIGGSESSAKMEINRCKCLY